jgi:hypothetical protein
MQTAQADIHMLVGAWARKPKGPEHGHVNDLLDENGT